MGRHEEMVSNPREHVMKRIRAGSALGIVSIAVLFGWAAGQYPYLLEPGFRISDAAGAHATLVAILVVLGAGAVLVVPALVWLFVLMQRGALAGEP